MTEPVCLNCNRTDAQIPLLSLTFRGEAKYICAQCFPILIHKIHLLADELPGVETTPPTDHCSLFTAHCSLFTAL